MPAEQNPGQNTEESFGIRILKDGTWLYNGTPITRHNLVKLFASVLSRDETGDYWLITPVERGRIAVEDAPFIAVEMKTEGAGPKQNLQFRTNLDDWVTLSADNPLQVRDGAPYILVRRGLQARISRAVYYDMVKNAAASPDDKNILGVYSKGAFFALGPKDL